MTKKIVVKVKELKTRKKKKQKKPKKKNNGMQNLKSASKRIMDQKREIAKRSAENAALVTNAAECFILGKKPSLVGLRNRLSYIRGFQTNHAAINYVSGSFAFSSQTFSPYTDKHRSYATVFSTAGNGSTVLETVHPLQTVMATEFAYLRPISMTVEITVLRSNMDETWEMVTHVGAPNSFIGFTMDENSNREGCQIWNQDTIPISGIRLNLDCSHKIFDEWTSSSNCPAGTPYSSAEFPGISYKLSTAAAHTGLRIIVRTTIFYAFQPTRSKEAFFETSNDPIDPFEFELALMRIEGETNPGVSTYATKRAAFARDEKATSGILSSIRDGFTSLAGMSDATKSKAASFAWGAYNVYRASHVGNAPYRVLSSTVPHLDGTHYAVHNDGAPPTVHKLADPIADSKALFQLSQTLTQGQKNALTDLLPSELEILQTYLSQLARVPGPSSGSPTAPTSMPGIPLPMPEVKRYTPESPVLVPRSGFCGRAT